jgi:hypothetical protein
MKTVSRRAVILTAHFLACFTAASAAGITPATFLARRDYPGLNGAFVQVADTNGDGIPDLLICSSGSIEVLFGSGDGTFRSGPSTNPGLFNGVSFGVADLNGDGNVDVVIPDGNEIGISMGNGDGTFQAATVYKINDTGAFYLVLGNFNGDGILDVATPGNLGVWLFTGKGDGAFNPGVLAASLPGNQLKGYIAAADFNGDHNLDLVVTQLISGPGQTGGSVVLLGNGNGTFQSSQTLAEPASANAVAIITLTKGGAPSIAIASLHSTYTYLYVGDGAGGFSGPARVSLPGVGRAGLAIGDVNGDGFPDMVSSGGYIAFGRAGDHFSSPVSYPVDTINGSFNVALADLRNNGLTDIVTDAYDSISVLLNTGKGKYEDGIWTAVPGGAGCGVSADFNGDGKPDVAVITTTGVSILLGTGKAKSPFTTGTSVAVAEAACMVTGDLNGDGIPDLLVAVNGSPNALISYLGNGDGTFTLKSTTSTPNSGGIVLLADFNHDGKLDFATSGNLMALGNGDGTFQTPAPFVSNPPSSGFSGIAAGDINNDGWPDLVLTNSQTNPPINAFVLLNNQQGGFTQVPSPPSGEAQQPILADVNGDGNLDLIVAAAVGNGALVCLGNGTGTFTQGPNLLGMGRWGAGPGWVVVADVNGDGIPDVLIQGIDTIVVHLGVGGAQYARPLYVGTGFAPSDVFTANLHGQSPSAGLPDIVAPDANQGVMVLINVTK